VQESIVDVIEARFLKAYEGIRFGDLNDASTLCGPLIDEDSVQTMEAALEAVQKEGGKLLCGGGRAEMQGDLKGSHFVVPAIVCAKNEYKTVQDESFAPILHIIPVNDFDDAVAKLNGVPQGLTSAIFTRDIRKGERFLSAIGSDCDIAKINIGTSGAEIGGEKGHRRRPRTRLRHLEILRAPSNQHGQLVRRFAVGPGHRIWLVERPSHR